MGALIAFGISTAIGKVFAGFSSMLAAILVGIITTNVVRIPERFSTGIAFCSRRVLRTGVVLLGFGVGVTDIVKLGWDAFGIAVAVVFCALAAGVLAGRAMGLSREQSLLTSAGCAICGAAAVAGVEGTLQKSKQHEVATAIAIVVAYGTAMIFIGPLVASALNFDTRDTGVFLGASIHEVAHVVAAGGIAGGGALTIAVIVKLARVLMLAPIMVGLSVVERKNATTGDSSDTKLPPIMPLFVAGFIAAVAVRSTGILPTSVLHILDQVKTWFFLVAMVALGTGVHRDTLRAAGWKPFLHGLVPSAVAVAVPLLALLVF